ncbi:MAG: VWA domain-containing protein [Myxococcales bacterium]|nr:VWA domain-containing protein [Myxococcota bacterium]MDW8283457.1 VWA domain-containing protein [Myxococcales bacterium]
MSRLLTLLGLELRQPLLLLSVLLALPLYLFARRSGGRIVFSSLRLLPATHRGWRVRLARLPAVLLALGGLCLGLASAGPRIPDRSTRVRKQGIAIMMVVDISGSMRALDLSEPGRERTRLDAAMEVFRHFVAGGRGLRGRPDDLIGLVSFAAYADTRCPLTLDHDNVLRAAEGLSIVTRAEEDGTALGDGLGLALERLRESRARSRVAILLTDGVNNRGETTPMQAAELAQALGIRVYTVGAGTNGMAPIRVEDAMGRSFLARVPVEIDEKTLTAIAERTGGRYFRALDADGLRRAYQEIDALERSEIVDQRFARYTELYPYLAGPGLGLITLSLLLSGTLLRRVPA